MQPAVKSEEVQPAERVKPEDVQPAEIVKPEEVQPAGKSEQPAATSAEAQPAEKAEKATVCKFAKHARGGGTSKRSDLSTEMKVPRYNGVYLWDVNPCNRQRFKRLKTFIHNELSPVDRKDLSPLHMVAHPYLKIGWFRLVDFEKIFHVICILCPSARNGSRTMSQMLGYMGFNKQTSEHVLIFTFDAARWNDNGHRLLMNGGREGVPNIIPIEVDEEYVKKFDEKLAQ